MQNSLEEKQAYLRDNIETNQYEDFYEYCEKEIGSTDIYSWTLQDVAKVSILKIRSSIVSKIMYANNK